MGEHPGSGTESGRTRLIVGWAITGFGVLVTAATLVISIAVLVTAETTTQFTALLVSSLFFAAFPALMGLGLVIWGRKMVLKARTGRPG